MDVMLIPEIAEPAPATTLNLPCYLIPYGLNPRFFGRSLEKEALKRSLQPQEDRDGPQIIAIYGIGGVGKTQLALHYANTSLELYDIVIWIPAETLSHLTETLTLFSVKLGLSAADEIEDEHQVIQKLRDWLNTSGHTFLLVFDNVQDHEILEPIWPASNKGTVIITCRSQATASKCAAEVMHLQCFPVERCVDVLYSLTGLQPLSEKDAAAAKELVRLLDGFPLAMVQISEFINNRGSSYEEFLPIFKRSAAKVFARTGTPLQYEHTMATVWDNSFQKLSFESRALLNILSFFDPGLIPESVVSNKSAGITEPSLQFLFDDFDFGDAVIGLTKASLVTRLPSHRALSVHRLVQFTALSRLSSAERTMYLDCAIQVLTCAFPNTWNERGIHQGHGWASWEACSVVVPHVNRLIEVAEVHSVKPTNPELFAELVFRIGTYLWEREQPTAARSLIRFGLQLEISASSRNYAQAHRLLGHIALDLAQPKAALLAYQKALNVREGLEEPNSPPIAEEYESIACSFAEQGQVAKAFGYLAKAADIHRIRDPLQMSRTHAIYAMAHLRAGQPEKALLALQRCWRLQNMTEEQVIASKYPKHSGDIVLLSRIKYAQGLKKEARQLASQAISIRRGIFGDKGPRVADSMFIAARMLEADGEDALAANLLRTVVEMSRDVCEMQAHLARSLWFLAMAERRMGNTAIAEKLADEARNERDKIQGREAADSDTDSSFMSLVSWMLW
ncbi:hypothetical protein VTO42DRAFT_8801 [Malbranchea cinnamomea]